jgi:hypothetical protein
MFHIIFILFAEYSAFLKAFFDVVYQARLEIKIRTCCYFLRLVPMFLSR